MGSSNKKYLISAKCSLVFIGLDGNKVSLWLSGLFRLEILAGKQIESPTRLQSTCVQALIFQPFDVFVVKTKEAKF